MYYSIKKRLLLGTACILLAALVPAGLYVAYFLRAEGRQDAREVAVNILRGTEWALSNHAPFADAKALDAWGEGYEAATGMRLSYIVDGTLVADSQVEYTRLPSAADHSGRPEIVAAIKSGLGVDTRFSTTVGKRFIYAALATEKIPGMKAGVLRVAMPDLAVSGRLEHMEWHLALIFAGAYLISCTLLGVLLLGVFRYLDGLMLSAQAIGQGRYSHRMPDTRCRELLPFTATMNVMAMNIERQMRELAEEKNQLETVLDTMEEGVLTLDAGGRVVRWNRAAQVMFARNTGGSVSLGGKLLMEVVMHAGLQEKTAGLLQSMEHLGEEEREGPSLRTAPVRIAASGGKSYLASLIPLPSGGLARVMLVFADVSERERLDAMRRDFVANVSHELRTPLTNIRGFAELLQDNVDLSPEKRAEFLEVITRNIAHMARMTDSLLTLARTEHAASTVISDTADAAAALRSTVSEFEPVFMEKAVRVHSDIPESALHVTGDADSLREIFRNLLENAVKYGGGKIDVRARSQGEQLVISVRDYGAGIPEASRERIFERFYRLERSGGEERKTTPGSVGLGLAICRHIARNLGGSVRAETPEDNGPGTAFVVKLDLRGDVLH